MIRDSPPVYQYLHQAWKLQLDEGELTKPPEIPREEAEGRVGNEEKDQGILEADTGPDLEIRIIPWAARVYQ